MRIFSFLIFVVKNKILNLEIAVLKQHSTHGPISTLILYLPIPSWTKSSVERQFPSKHMNSSGMQNFPPGLQKVILAYYWN